MVARRHSISQITDGHSQMGKGIYMCAFFRNENGIFGQNGGQDFWMLHLEQINQTGTTTLIRSWTTSKSNTIENLFTGSKEMHPNQLQIEERQRAAKKRSPLSDDWRGGGSTQRRRQQTCDTTNRQMEQRRTRCTGRWRIWYDYEWKWINSLQKHKLYSAAMPLAVPIHFHNLNQGKRNYNLTERHINSVKQNMWRNVMRSAVTVRLHRIFFTHLYHICLLFLKKCFR